MIQFNGSKGDKVKSTFITAIFLLMLMGLLSVCTSAKGDQKYELDELPVIAARLDLELRPGMVVAVEPKAFLEGIGPVGIENTYLITPGGCESLCTAECEIMSIRSPALQTARSSRQ